MKMMDDDRDVHHILHEGGKPNVIYNYHVKQKHEE